MLLRYSPGEETKMTTPLMVTTARPTVIVAASSAGSFMGWGVRIG